MISLQERDDFALVVRVRRDNCADSLRALITRHGALYCSIVSRMCKKYNNWTNAEDLFAEKDYIIYQSAIKYKRDKQIKFSTFIGNQAKWNYLNKSNKMQKILKKESRLIENLNHTQPEELNQDAIETMKISLKMLSRHPDSRIPKLFELRYKVGKNNKEMPWHLVGKKMNLSAQGCINLHKIGIDFLQNKFKQEGILC